MPTRAALIRLGFGAIAVALLVIAILVVADAGVAADAALAGTGLALVAVSLLALALSPLEAVARHLGRVRSLSLGALGIELADYAELAGRASEFEEADDRDGGAPETLFELRTRLEMKLAYLAKHVLAPDPGPNAPQATFLTIGSLLHDRLLTREQAAVANDILSMREHELRALSDGERSLFLAGADKFVKTVRITVFAAQVRNMLEELGWTVLQLAADGSHRDLLVQSDAESDGVQHHIAPAFTTRRDSSLLKKPHSRLERAARVKLGGRRVIVVPPLSRAAGRTLTGGVEVMTLAVLLAALGEAPEADA